MAETISTPRVDAQYLDNFKGQTVRITGKVTQLLGDQALIDANGTVTLALNRALKRENLQDSHLTVGNAIEIVGRVNQDLSVKVLQATDMGTNLDFKAISAVVEATHRHKEIFYGDSSGD